MNNRVNLSILTLALGLSGSAFADTLSIPPGSTLLFPQGGTVQLPTVEPPPPPSDTDAPTITITDDKPDIVTVDGGDVLFTFVVNEPITGFDKNKIVISHGVAGVFTAVGPSAYTLLVTPDRDFLGDLVVDLPMGAGFDNAGNPSTAVRAIQAVDTRVIPPPPPPTPVVTTATHVELVFADGNKVSFDRKDAKDLGAYNGEFVHQNNFFVRNGAWSVSFRPDVDEKRDEVVVEYGTWPIPADVKPAHVAAPFKAIILGEKGVITTVDVPFQWWLTRWRWKSADRPVVRHLADLVAMKAHLPLSEKVIYGKVPNASLPNAVWTGPMGVAGLVPKQGTPGDRNELGPDSNLQTGWLLRENPEALRGMLAQAEAAGSFPMWVRDNRTNALLDVYANPYIAFNSASAKYPPINPVPNPRDATGAVPQTYVATNVSHFPAVSWTPWLVTDDPYFLEGEQMAAIYASTESNYHTLTQKLPGLTQLAASRSVAWGLRAHAHMAGFAPENPPSWLLPRSNFKKMLDDDRTYFGRVMASPLKPFKVFHLYTPLSALHDTWMQGYGLSVMGWMRWSDQFPEWNDAVDWAAGSLLQFVGDASKGEWAKQWPFPYTIPIVRMRLRALNDATKSANIDPLSPPSQVMFTEGTTKVTVGDLDAQTPDSYGELYQLYSQWMATVGTPIKVGPDDKIYEQPTDNPPINGKNVAPTGPHYGEVERGAICALAAGGTPGAQQPCDWLTAKLGAVYAAYRGTSSSFRYAYPTN